MKRWIFKFVVFVIFAVFLIYYFVLNENPAIKRKQYFIRQVRGLKYYNGEYLVLGDSHAVNIPYHQLGENFYNAAFGSDSLREIYFKLLYVIRHNPNLKYVLLSCEYQTLSEYRRQGANSDYIKLFAKERLYSEVYGTSNKKGILEKYLSRYPIFDNNVYVFVRMRILNSIRRIFERHDVHKGVELKWQEFSSKQRSKKAVNRAKTQLREIVSQELVEILHKIIALCKKHDIKVIAIQYPLSQEFLREARKYEISKVQKIYKGIRFEKFLDYTQLIRDSRYFLDTDHLNSDGAKVFFKEILKHLK